MCNENKDLINNDFQSDRNIFDIQPETVFLRKTSCSKSILNNKFPIFINESDSNYNFDKNSNNINLENYNIIRNSNSKNTENLFNLKSESKIFSNQNLYLTNSNIKCNNEYESKENIIRDSEVFEKPYSIFENKFKNNSNKNNLKFSNTDIPQVFDEIYIQKRINKAEIYSPSLHKIDLPSSILNQNLRLNPTQNISKLSTNSFKKCN